MALDFTVVFSNRQRFGDRNDEDAGLETQAPLVGSHKAYEFQCPNVDSSKEAILLFQCQGSVVEQTLRINEQEIFGGIPSGSVGNRTVSVSNSLPITQSIAQWSGNVMLIQPGVLRESNKMLIRAQQVDNGVDNFVIDNLVVVFKTRQGQGPIIITDVAMRGDQ